MRVLFWGTPAFAVPTLRALTEEGHEVVGVVTQPDRPAGRGRPTRTSPVKKAAEQDGLIVLTPDVPRGQPFEGRLRALKPEVGVVVAYGHILHPEILDIPVVGFINLHASLLPELRGAAPINWAIIRGHERTGVTVMRMVEAMDAGPVLVQEEEPIGPSETATELASRLSEIGAVAMVEALALLSLGPVEETEQDSDAVTFAPKIDRLTARIDWSSSADEVANLIRGMDATPGAWTNWNGAALKLFRPTPFSDSQTMESPGTVTRADAQEGLLISTGQGLLEVGEVQPSGKRRMSTSDWIRGRGVEAGRRFE